MLWISLRYSPRIWMKLVGIRPYMLHVTAFNSLRASVMRYEVLHQSVLNDIKISSHSEHWRFPWDTARDFDI